MIKVNKKQREILKKYFDYINTDYNDEDLYLETWTNGGVDMYISLDKNKSLIENLEYYLECFDIDEEIDLYRQSKDYREAFTITESVDDFRSWIEYIENVIELLKGCE